MRQQYESGSIYRFVTDDRKHELAHWATSSHPETTKMTTIGPRMSVMSNLAKKNVAVA